MSRVQRSPRPYLILVPLLLVALFLNPFGKPTLQTQVKPPGQEQEGPCTECCTSLLAGKEATVDGSTMTSHSCDSGTDRTWIKLEPHESHPRGSLDTIWLLPKETTGPNDPDRMYAGTIPQVAETFKYMDTAYPAMNEHQLAIGETTTGGKRELRSREGLIDAPELYRLALERTKKEDLEVLAWDEYQG